jgi:hypothetical protein
MSTPDYPLLTVPGYELYQLAHLTSVAVDALARRRQAAGARDRLGQRPPAAGTTSADAAAGGPTPATRLPGGFAAAAAALPSPDARPPQNPDAAEVYHHNTGARTSIPARSRSVPSPREASAP